MPVYATASGIGFERHHRLGRSAGRHAVGVSAAANSHRPDDRAIAVGYRLRRRSRLPARCRAGRLGHRHRHERSDGFAGTAKDDRRHAERQRPAIAGARCAHSLVAQPAVSSQQDDGGWTWTGHGKGSHRFTSARVVWALAMARKAGYKLADDQFEKANNYLQSQIAATAETDFESKAILLHALATTGQRRFHAGQPALSQSPGAEQRGAGVSGAGVRRDGSQADGRGAAWRFGQAESRRCGDAPLSGAAVRCRGAHRRSNCGRSTPWRWNNSRRKRRRRKRPSIG